MFEVLLLVFFLLLVFATFVAFWFVHSPRQSARLPYFLKLTDRLLTLLAALQQYRGMSVAQLSGSHLFGRELLAVEQKITGQFVLLIQDLDEESVQLFPCLQINEVKLLRHHWQSALQQHETATPSDVFQKQSQYIEQVMQWLLRLGKRRLSPILLPLYRHAPMGARGGKLILQNYVAHLPALAESLGQLRGLGTRLCALGQVSDAEENRLVFLLSCAQDFLQRARARYAVETTSGHAAPWLAVTQAEEKIDTFLTIVHENLLVKRVAGLSPKDFFTTGSAAVDSVYDWLKLERLYLLEAGLSHHN